jgi:hypothetical protein
MADDVRMLVARGAASGPTLVDRIASMPGSGAPSTGSRPHRQGRRMGAIIAFEWCRFQRGHEKRVPLRRWVRAYRIVFALLALAVIAYQLVTQSQRPGFVPANFFSFFTIQSNLIAAFLFVYLVAARPVPSRWLDLVRGAAVMALTLMGVVHAVLLSGYQALLGVPELSVDTVQHRLMPLVFLLDWFIEPPRGRIGPAQASVWTLYPLVYFGYTLLRGMRVDWYPYFFLDPRQDGGYVAVLATAAAIMGGFLATTSLLVLISQRPRTRFAIRRCWRKDKWSV